MNEPIDSPRLQLYGACALQQAQRILGLGDRDPDSPTFGCFDRYYWHYRQVDFTNSRFQEASHYLALLYLYNHPQNKFYQKPKIKEWAEAAIHYWTKIQVNDGSFNEYWPNERSFCVTSFTTYATAEACRLLELSPPEDHLRNACRWIRSHENRLVLNQMACSAVALLLCSVVLDDELIRQWADQRMETVLELQHPDGYFPEYDGFDTGYLTITLSCMAQYSIHQPDPRLEEAMRKAFRYLDNKIRPDGTHDYSTTSRQTQYFYPYGFVVMQEWELLNRHLNGLEQDNVIQPGWFDDRYCLPIAIDYLQSGCYASENQ